MRFKLKWTRASLRRSNEFSTVLQSLESWEVVTSTSLGEGSSANVRLAPPRKVSVHCKFKGWFVTLGSACFTAIPWQNRMWQTLVYSLRRLAVTGTTLYADEFFGQIRWTGLISSRFTSHKEKSAVTGFAMLSMLVVGSLWLGRDGDWLFTQLGDSRLLKLWPMNALKYGSHVEHSSCAFECPARCAPFDLWLNADQPPSMTLDAMR